MKKSDEELLARFSRYQTPFYYYDGDALREHVSRLLEKLHPAVKMHYAFKANGNISIAGMLRSLGCAVEIASGGEMYAAMEAGYQPEEMLYAGPGKTGSELNEAAISSIGCIHIESVRELRLLEHVAKRNGVTVRAAVRINPASDVSGSTIKMGGVPRPFGIDETQIGCFFEGLKDCPHIQFQGIQIYTGTQMLEADQILASFQNTYRLAERIQAEYGVSMKTINLGGGFGIPYFAHEKELDIDQVIQGLNLLAEQAVSRMPGVILNIESGRYLVAQSAMYVCRALYTKESKGEKFVVADGGMNHYASAAFRGQRVRDNYPVRVIQIGANRHEAPEHDHDTREGMTPTETVSVVGPLCTPEDCLVKKAELPLIEEGDYICIPNAGAYGLSYSPIHFLGHSTPAELLDVNGEVYVIRERGNRTDLLRHQRFVCIDHLVAADMEN